MMFARKFHFALGILSLVPLFTADCSPPECSSVNSKPGEISASNWKLADAASGIPIVTLAADWRLWLAKSVDGDGKHYDLAFGPPLQSMIQKTSAGEVAIPLDGSILIKFEYVSKSSLMATKAVPFGDFADPGRFIPTITLFHDGAWRIFNLASVQGTISATGTAPDQNGTTTISLDLPDTTLTSDDGKLTIGLAFQHLSGTDTRTTTYWECSVGGGGSPFNYTGWLPGGG